MVGCQRAGAVLFAGIFAMELLATQGGMGRLLADQVRTTMLALRRINHGPCRMARPDYPLALPNHQFVAS